MKSKAVYIGAITVAYILYSLISAQAAINGNEAELLAIINSTREYNGVWYQVAPEYRETARAYLDDPSIDCTDEQKQKAINQMFGSIQQGIDEGYLIPVGGNTSEKNSESNPGADRTVRQASEEFSIPSADGETEAYSEPVMEMEVEENDRGNLTASEMESSSVTMDEEREAETTASPIVRALDEAMTVPTETLPALEENSLLPDIPYPDKAVKAVSAVILTASLLCGGLGGVWGLFHHNRKKYI